MTPTQTTTQSTTQSTTHSHPRARRTALALVAGAALVALAPAAAHAASGTPTETGKTSGKDIVFFTKGKLAPGGEIDFFADCGRNKNGIVVTQATVEGPAGMKTTLTPAADRPYLYHSVVVPKSYTAKTATFKLTCDNMATGTVTVGQAQIAAKPKGGARTGGEPMAAAPTDKATDNQAGLFAGLGALGLAGIVGIGVGARKLLTSGAQR